MDSLPIRLLTDEDASIFGPLNVSLGKLARAGLPVAEGMVIIQGSNEPKVEISHKKLKASGSAFYDPLENDVMISVASGKPHPMDLKKIVEVVNLANKKLFLPYVYEWVIDGEVKLTGLLPYTGFVIAGGAKQSVLLRSDPLKIKSAVKVFLDLSLGFVIEKEVDGIYIDSFKVKDSEELTVKLVESAAAFPSFPVLLKLAPKLEPVLAALDFARHKKGLSNIHIVIPSVRICNEFMQIKRELAVKKLMRKHSLQLWLELSVPENIINLEDYLVAGLDGVILNLDELIAHINGFNLKNEEQSGYKKEVQGLLKFLEDGIKLLHKSQTPFIAVGNISLYSEVLDFLVAKGVYGIVVEKYEAHSMADLLRNAEKKNILSLGIS